jgi:hypothetical protein
MRASTPATAEIEDTSDDDEAQVSNAPTAAVLSPTATPADEPDPASPSTDDAIDDATADEPASQPDPSTVAWPQFQSVRLAGQVLVALLMIGLFVAAYALILGGRDGGIAKNEGANELTPADPGPPDLKIDQGQPVTIKPAEAAIPAPAPAAAPAAPTEPAAAPAEPPATPAVAPAAPPAVAQSIPAAEAARKQPAPAASPGPIEPEPPGMRVDTPTTLAEQTRAATSGGLSRNTVVNPMVAETPTHQDTPGPATAPATPNAEPPPVERQPAREAAEPLASPYPITDPARFQYPANYQERFQPRTNTAAAPNGSPWSANRTGGAWQPSTARLQAPAMR